MSGFESKLYEGTVRLGNGTIAERQVTARYTAEAWQILSDQYDRKNVLSCVPLR